MAERREHSGTAFDMAGDIGLHGVKGRRQVTCFLWAGQRQWRNPFPAADAFGGLGQGLDRAHYAADAEHHDQQHRNGRHRQTVRQHISPFVGACRMLQGVEVAAVGQFDTAAQPQGGPAVGAEHAPPGMVATDPFQLHGHAHVLGQLQLLAQGAGHSLFFGTHGKGFDVGLGGDPEACICAGDRPQQPVEDLVPGFHGHMMGGHQSLQAHGARQGMDQRASVLHKHNGDDIGGEQREQQQRTELMQHLAGPQGAQTIHGACNVTSAANR